MPLSTILLPRNTDPLRQRLITIIVMRHSQSTEVDREDHGHKHHPPTIIIMLLIIVVIFGLLRILRTAEVARTVGTYRRQVTECRTLLVT